MSAEGFKAFEAAGWSDRAGTYETLMARATAAAVEPLLDAPGAGPDTAVLPTTVRIATACCPR